MAERTGAPPGNRRRLAVTVLAASAVLVPLGACSDDDSDTSTTTTAAITTTTEASRDFQVSTPDGQVSLSLDGQLPPGWPEDFPLPEGAEPAGSGSVGDASSTVRVGVFTTPGSGQETLDFYSENPDVESGEPSVAGSGDRFVGSLDLTSPETGSVTVLSREGSAYLIVVLSEDGTGTTTSTTTTTG